MNKKEEAIKLRMEGKTYREINKLLGISISTQSNWFGGLDWSKIIHTKNDSINRSSSRERINKMNQKRDGLLVLKYKNHQNEAEKLFNKYKGDVLFHSGLMLYLGEGDKSTKNTLVRLSNVDTGVFNIFISFLDKYCNKYKGKIRFWVLLYPDNNIEESEVFWSKATNIDRSCFYKSQIIKGKSKNKKLQYGVGNIIISSKELKVIILKWIDMSKIYLAGII